MTRSGRNRRDRVAPSPPRAGARAPRPSGTRRP